MANGGVDIYVDASDLRKVMKIAKTFSPALAKQLRKQLRAAGQMGADAAKSSIREMPVSGSSDNGLRDMIARATKVSITTSRNADVRIKVQKTKELIDYGAPGLAKAINTGRWKHPVFAAKGTPRYDDKANWPEQQGDKFFDDRIQALAPQMQLMALAALEAALLEATKGTEL
jgi:hypothetical protein